MLRVLDLFSGIGGFSLGLERTGGFRTVQFCEIDPFCRRVLAKHWPNVPCHDDVRTLDAAGLGSVDLVCGGYPCQPFSHAGQRRGAEDDRHLWPEMARIVDQLRPAWVCGENVAGHVGMGLDEVLSDLEALGYACRPFVVPACAVDAPHRRDRVWIVARHADSDTQGTNGAVRQGAHAQSDGVRAHGHANGQGQPARPIDAEASGMPGDVADAHIERCESGGNGWLFPARSEVGRCTTNEWLPEPDVGLDPDGLPAGLAGPWSGDWEAGIPRVATDVPDRINKLRALGNAVVPQVVEQIGRAILKAEAAE